LGVQQGIYFILYDTENRIIGYAWTNKWNHSLYVHYLCSNHIDYKGAGTVLLKHIIQYAKTNGYTSVLLSSVSSAIPFYKGHGFVKTNPECPETGSCEMILQFTNGGTYRKRGKTQNRQRRRRQTRR
jgi:hypothetical protein